MPTAVVVKEPEVAPGGVAPLSALVEVNTGVPVQVAFPGGNRLKVTCRSGLNPPLTVAVSEMDVPTGPPAEAWWRWSAWPG